MNEPIRKAFRDRFQGKALFDEPLRKYLAYQVGGPADVLVFPEDEKDLQSLSEFATQFNLPVTIVGNGTIFWSMTKESVELRSPFSVHSKQLNFSKKIRALL